MPKASKNKYYAVKLGREGPKIYNTWDEVSPSRSDTCPYVQTQLLQVQNQCLCPPGPFCFRSLHVLRYLGILAQYTKVSLHENKLKIGSKNQYQVPSIDDVVN